MNVLSQTGGVVWKFYESVLNRAPDYGGLKYWINDFVHGGKTGDIAAGFFESDELLNQIVTGYYQQYLHRAPDASGLAHWRQVWHATGGPEIIKAGFADSPEFYASAGGTPETWITELYLRILNREPDPQGKQYWLNYLTSHGDTAAAREHIALGFFTSQEAYQGDVTGWFQEYLQRAPTAERTESIRQRNAGRQDRPRHRAGDYQPARIRPASACGARRNRRSATELFPTDGLRRQPATSGFDRQGLGVCQARNLASGDLPGGPALAVRGNRRRRRDSAGRAATI